MKTNREKRPKDWREIRRLRSWELKQSGWKQIEIAEALGVSTGAVSQWVKRGRTGGKESLRTQKIPGRPAGMDESELVWLEKLLSLGAEEFGFRGELWTRKRVGTVIEVQFGIIYTPEHVGRILRKINWSLQKPQKTASQRDDEEIERWYREEWPRIKKRLKKKGER